MRCLVLAYCLSTSALVMDEAGDEERMPPPPPPLCSLPAGDAERPLLPTLEVLLGRMYLWPNCCPPADMERMEAPALEDDADTGRSNIGLGCRPLPEAWMLKAPVFPPWWALSVSRLEEDAVPSI
jgi:hypothetical protein